MTQACGGFQRCAMGPSPAVPEPTTVSTSSVALNSTPRITDFSSSYDKRGGQWNRSLPHSLSPILVARVRSQQGQAFAPPASHGGSRSSSSSIGRKKRQGQCSSRKLWEAQEVQCCELCGEGRVEEAVRVLERMVQEGGRAGSSVFYPLLKKCIAEKDAGLGSRVHALAVRCGHGSDIFVANHVIRMYASHARLEEATEVFSTLIAPNAFVWASIIKAHADQGQADEAIKLYRRMRASRTAKPNNHVFAAVLNACASVSDLDSGKQVHADLLQCEDEADMVVGSCLVDMYAKCGNLDDARRVFDNLPARDVVTWTAMIAGYANHGLGQEALDVFANMQQEGITPANSFTYTCLLKACANTGALHIGWQLHRVIRERGLENNLVIGSALVDMYAKCGSLQDARKVFDTLPVKNVVTWNAMIAGYVQHGFGQEALDLYATMEVQDSIMSANNFTYAGLLKACATIGALHEGKHLHSLIQGRGLQADVVVGSCLVDMYVRCGSLEDARQVFDNLPTRDVVTWTAMIAGYSQLGLGQEALNLYAAMQGEEDLSVAANDVTFACLLNACASVGALQQGQQLHLQIQERGLESDTLVGNCLVDMYAKCGSLQDSRRVFDRLAGRDVVAWTALMNGYAQHGDAEKAIRCFEEMQQQGVKPNGATFISLLVACSHGGLVAEGQQFFRMMIEQYGIVPTDFHYNCMIDLLGRAGQLDKAEDMLRSLPCENQVVGWTCLLSACKSHADIERGTRCFDRIVSLEPENGSGYVLLGTIYANAGRWSDVDKLERMRISAGAWKKPAKASIEVNKKVHEFTVGEDTVEIALKLRTMNSRVQSEGGHVPQTELVLKAVSDREKEDSLCGHAEKLALAFGLQNTPPGSTLLVTKNLRMCNDCHSSTKIMSRLEMREIVVRDAHRVHRFLDGSCSCGDRP